MKKLVVLLALLNFTISCSLKNKKITGNEKIVTITRSTSEYEGISISGSFDVKLISGKEGNISIKGDENLLEFIVTEITNGKLLVYFEKHKKIQYNYNSSIEITIPFEDINQLSFNGSGNLTTTDLIKTEYLNIEMTGSGNTSFRSDTNSLKITKSGSGNLNGKGVTKNIEINSDGSGNVTMSDLKSENAVASQTGSGNIKVNCSKNLDARTIGSGTIQYSGKPEKIAKSTTGSGSINGN
ncbi:MAG: hypothetical protein RLZZ306_3463 [Bacteroidota bacterium]|jgi:hypothetical protein